MRRSYAFGLGSCSQAATQLPDQQQNKPPDAMTLALLMGMGWGTNLGVAEWLIWRRRVTLQAVA